MKHKIIALFLVAICGFSWFFVIKSYKSGENEYKTCMEEASASLEKKIYVEAEEKYQKALNYRPNDKEAQLGLAQVYYLTEEYDKAVTILEKIQKTDPKDTKTATFLAKCLISGGEYKKSLEILGEVEQTNEIIGLISEIKSKYSLTYKNILQVKEWWCIEGKATSCAAQEVQNYVIYSTSGKKLVSGDLTYIGPVSDDGETYPAIHENTWCYVDSDGNRKLVPDKEYSFLGPFYNGYAVAKYGDYFGYIDEDFNEYHFEFESAYNFREGKAAVIKNGMVEIINTDFSIAIQTNYTGIVSDEYGFTNHYGFSVFKNDENYYFCTSNGEQVGEVIANYIGLPNESGGIVPYLKDGKYGYLNTTDGSILMEPTYDDARASSNGLCAVKMGDKWGYIDTKGTKITDFMFEYAGSVSKDGTAFVENEAGFALLSFYYLSE